MYANMRVLATASATSLDRTMNLHPQVYQHMVIMMGTSQQIPVRD
jgi:hypothetical protein